MLVLGLQPLPALPARRQAPAAPCRGRRLQSLRVSAFQWGGRQREEAQDAPTTTSDPEYDRGNGWQLARQCLRTVGVAAAACAAAAALVLSPGLPLPQDAHAVTTEQLLFLEAWRAVDRAYVDKGFNGQSWFRVRETFLKKTPMDTRTQTYDAIRQMLATLDDPFTRLLEPSRLERLRRGTGGSVTGVGVEVTLDSTAGAAGSELVVVAPLAGGPSDRAGVRAGDIISQVDDKPTRGISLYEASDLLQGPPGTSVSLTLSTPKASGGNGTPRTVTITREVLSVSPVSYATCSGVSASTGLPAPAGGGGGGAGAAGGRLGYLRLTTFNANTVEAVTQALQEAKSDGVDGLVVDLRNNGGGLFPAGVQVAKLLQPRGDIVLIADSEGVRDIFGADGRGVVDASTPLSVWVNKGTASASEVLAGSLKDNGRGVVVGENTFGKGLIQTVINLSDGSGLAVTVAKYQTPAGVDINRVGVTPNIRVAPDLLAVGGDKVCKQLAQPDAPRLFG